MGAISLLFYNMKNPPVNIDFAKSFNKMKNRGEDDTQIGIEQTPTITAHNKTHISNYLSKKEISEYRPITFQYGYHRMSINDASLDGSQPFEDPIPHKMLKYPELRSRPKRKLMCNGEVYNYTELVKTFELGDKDLQSKSDVEVILPIYIKCFEKLGDSTLGLHECLSVLNADYSFMIMENTTSFSLKDINIFIVRDCLGTKPLYMVKYTPFKPESNKTDMFYMFVSEIKGIPLHILNDPEYTILEVPPGTYWSYKNSVIEKSKTDFIKFYDFGMYKTLDICSVNTAEPSTIIELYNNIRTMVIQSIIDRYELADQKVGLLLSGGFDSCIILSILIKYLVEKYNYKDPLHVFTIGDDDNTDVINARFHVWSLESHYNIDIHHHVVKIEDMEMINDELTNIVLQLETYDRITIQKSIPMAFLLKYVKNHTDTKVLLSGEGLDELCGYYQLFTLSDSDFQKRSVDLLENLSKYDLLRADKIAGSYGLEIRQPFLDMRFIEYILQVHPMLKRPQMSGYSDDPIEKYIIRKAFDTVDNLHIDKRILWNHRQDIRYSFNTLKETLRDFFDNLYSDFDLENYIETLRMSTDLVHLIPSTKEEMHYKKIFDTYYPCTSNVLSLYWNLIWQNK
jgi:asparagine synthase (glutamine-hydrolysing)